MEVNHSVSSEDIQCNICDRPTQSNYGVLKSKWDSIFPNDEKYEVHLCKSCFFTTLSHLKSQKKLHHLFDENFDFIQLDNLGLS